jgi:2-polyprenyl-3-methyl-5-hydroxy-6-metoxy-1,4-benzoquinol methylase
LQQDNSTYHTCWVCDSKDLDLIKKSSISDQLSSKNFAITNFEYGVTGELRKCRQCGFIQCTDLDEVVGFYEELEDHEYENGRKERMLQEKKVLLGLKRIKPEGTLLDVGAGSGMLVEAALGLGYDAEGIEPSKWLYETAQKHGLPIHQGIFPHQDTPGPYDIITLIDVLEHVTNPLELMTDLRMGLKKDGILVIVTPDVRSIPARLLKYKWWHYRVAHVGYFNRKNLALLSHKAGLQLLKQKRPTWYFSARYLSVRALSFLPKFLRFRVPGWLDKITIPLNLRDSILAIYKPDDHA